MDKRSLLFVAMLALTLFGINLFFEQRQTDKIREWNSQQAAKKAERLEKLHQEVKMRTAKPEDLPLAILYGDSKGVEPLAVGAPNNEAINAVAWDLDLPQKIYLKDSQDKISPPFTLAALPNAVGDPVVYRREAQSALTISELPEFGKYDLQLISLDTSSPEITPKIVLGEYNNGGIELPLEKIAKLKGEDESNSSEKILNFHHVLALVKTAEGYLPVAIYDVQQKLLEPLDAFPSLATAVVKEKRKKTIANQKASEQFYVLETPYQQLVFSNHGGALVEINLPFESTSNKKSVVKEIEFDREMVEKHPYNARFPSHSYYTAGEDPLSFVEHKQGTLGGYYPLLRRDLIEENRQKSIRILPRYYALNLVSEYPETAELVYEVKKFTKDTIVFETNQGHRRITKTYSVSSEDQAPYSIDLILNIAGDARGLWLTSGIPEVEWISGAAAPALKYRMTRNQKTEVQTIDLPKDSTTMTSTPLDWVCNSNGFLGMILDPLSEIDHGYRAQRISGTVVPSRLVEIDEEYQRFNPENMPGYMLLLPLKSSGGLMHFRIFAGPFASEVLKAVDKAYANPATGYNPDYIACQSFHGWFAFISEPFAKFLFILMNFFHQLTGSWALSIVLLTIALRIMLYPLNAWSTKSMVRMQQIAPEVTAIQEKYKKDPKKAQLEIMNLYRDRGVNPVSGCFPLLIQMPFLIGMFDLLKSTFELRGASFIPGWIDNLTAPDVLFRWNMPIPFIGNEFHLLPILLGLVMFLQQHLMSTLPKDPSLWTEQQRQQKFMGNIMAVVFTVMFYNFPSGLNIYWLSSMLLGILQQYWTTKSLNKHQVPATIAVSPKTKK